MMLPINFSLLILTWSEALFDGYSSFADLAAEARYSYSIFKDVRA
jgi:hypothetical protein